YVEKLRAENQRYRQQARDADDQRAALEAELWRLHVEASGRLADADDLPMPVDATADAETIDTAISDLLDRKPHLAARRAVGDIGQHDQRRPRQNVSLSALLRQNA